jgi:hypothetical protein
LPEEIGNIKIGICDNVKWISVNDQMPDFDDGAVLVSGKGNLGDYVIQIAFIERNDNKFCFVADDQTSVLDAKSIGNWLHLEDIEYWSYLPYTPDICKKFEE